MTPTLFTRLRRARWVHALQLLVFTFWVMNPFPGALSYWTDTNHDHQKEWAEDYPEGDSWLDQDSDGDSLTNAQEAVFGSDPYQIDSDSDGLTDLIEKDYSDPTAPFDPWNWDSDNDGFSDHDEYYQSIQGYTPEVNYASLSSAGTPFFSYADADGDGWKNFEDSDPVNNDRDGDSHLNWEDGPAYFNNVGGQFMDDPFDGSGPPPPGDDDGDGYNDVYDTHPGNAALWTDFDDDGRNETADSHPNDSSLWSDWNNDGDNNDSDGDEDGHDNPDDSHPRNASLWCDWNYDDTNDPESLDSDGDGRSDAADSDPSDNSLWSDWNHDLINNDSDGDEDGHDNPDDSHPRDATRWSDWDGNGVNNDTDGDEDGWNDSLDSHPRNSSLWSDWDGNDQNNDTDSDEDGHDNDEDSNPYDFTLWSDWNHDGDNSDNDGDEDGWEDANDSHPHYAGFHSDWNGDGDDNDADGDEDGVPDALDGNPHDASVLGIDTDGDGRLDTGDSHPQNNSLWSDWDGNGVNNDTDGDEDGWDDVTDSHPREPGFWSDYDQDNLNADQDSHPQNGSLWSDWDGNGVNNDTDGDEDNVADDNDSDPRNPALSSDWNHDSDDSPNDGDEDGYNDGNDSNPRNASLWCDWNYDDTNDPESLDSDGDGRPDQTDSDPGNVSLWSDWNHDGDNNDGDVDEDGVPNTEDSHPFNPALSTDWNGDGDNNPEDMDEDGHTNDFNSVTGDDSNPYDPALWSDWDHNGNNNDTDGDEDGILNENDSHPLSGALWSDWDHNGNNNDTDGDEDNEQDSQDSDPRNPALSSDWNHDGDDSPSDWDEDGHDNGSDSHPTDPNLWEDYDVDGYNAENDSHPSDNSRWSDWNNDGDNNETDGDDDGTPDYSDSDPHNYQLWEDWNRNGMNDNDEWTPPPPDDDGDGTPNDDDYWPQDPENGADSDGDGLSNYEERHAYQTDPSDVDSDDDMLTDKEELLTYHCNPNNARSINGNDLDWRLVDLSDNDHDGLPNRIESFYGLNSEDPADGNGDLDGDGISNRTAYLQGWDLRGNLNVYDLDMDGIVDAAEDYWNARQPGLLSSENFDDAVADNDEDGVLNYEEIRYGTSPLNATTYENTSDLLFINTALALNWSMSMKAGDVDGDGMPDVWEHRYGVWHYTTVGLDPRSAADVISDPDGDHLTNLNEYRFGSHPLVRESNQDSVDDASRLYATDVNQRALNGQNSRYQAQAVGDFTGTRTSGPGSFADISPGPEDQQEDPPSGPEEPLETVEFGVSSIAMPSGSSGEPAWDDSLTWIIGHSDPRPADSLSAYEDEAWIEAGGHWTTAERIVRAEWEDEDGNLHPPEVEIVDVWVPYYDYQSLPPPDAEPWNRKKVFAKASLDKADDKKDHHFNFKITTSSGDVSRVSLNIPKGSTTCTPPSISKLAPDGGWAMIEQVFDPQPGEDPENDDAHGDPNVSASDSAGSRYRKLGLNGVPLKDAKPQVQDESGERDEETHIDALTRHLQHAVTDIYANDSSTLLPLMARRDAGSDVWSKAGGLRPDERPDQPFGPCWSSNLCAFVQFQTGLSKPIMSAEVHDEQGSVQRFLAPKNTSDWQHSREEMSNARTQGNSFDGLVLRKKFGTTCTYEMTDIIQTMADNRLELEGDGEHRTAFTYARLSEVKDRLGNRLLYEYASSSSLIPSHIYDPDRPGRQIFIMHQGGRVTSVRGPTGEEVQYQYANGELASVSRGGVTVHYTYLHRNETKRSPYDPNANLDALDAHRHTEIASITDELDRSYGFAYEFDHSVVHVRTRAGTTAEKFQLGRPMCIKAVTMPDGLLVALTGNRSVETRSGSDVVITPSPMASTQVSGPAGSFNYVFRQPFIFVPNFAPGGLDDDPLSLQITVTYTRLELASAGGVEVFDFNSNAMFALSSAKDLSGNTTHFSYGADGFDDPVTETDALGNFKTFTYEPTTRVMSSMTDQTGVTTSYGIQPVTGLKLSETVRGAGGHVERQSTFQYEHPVFTGFMTRSTVDAGTDDTAPPTVTTYELGDGSLGWAEVTQTTQTSSGAVSSTTVHDLAGNKRSVIDGRGLVTNFNYDAHLRLVSVANPDGTAKQMQYDAHGNLVKETNETGTMTLHDYDCFNRRVRTTIDLNGNGVVDGNHGLPAIAQDAASISYNGDIVTTTTYNARGLVTKQTDARGKSTLHTYDSAGRLTQTKDGTLITTMEYGANSGGSVFDSSGFKPTKVTDPRGVVTEFTYDKMYRVTAKKVNYDVGAAPAKNPLKIVYENASMSFQQAHEQAENGRLTHFATVRPLERAVSRTNPAAAAAALQQATTAHQNAVADLTLKTSLRDQANLAEQAARADYEAALEAEAPVEETYQAAMQARMQAENAWNSAVHEVELAAAAATAAAANAATLVQAVDEVAATVAQATEALASAVTAVPAAQVAADQAQADLETAQGLLAEGETLSEIYVQAKTAADQALAAAITAKANAETAKTAAENALVAAQAQADDAQATADAAALEVPVRQAAAVQLEAPLAAARALEESERTNYQSAHGLVESRLTALHEKESELGGAESQVNEATGARDRALALFIEATGDQQDALAAQTDAGLRAQYTTELATAQSAFDTTAAQVQVLTAAETAAEQRRDDALEAVQASPDGMADIAPIATTATQYDAAGRPTRVTDPLGRVTLTVYDVFGQIQRVTRPDGTQLSTDYTHHGKPWKVTDEAGNTTQTEFDAAGRAVKTVSPPVNGVSAITSTQYDASGNAIRVTDPLGRITETQYDERNRPVAVYAPPVWDALAGTFVRPCTQTTYDAVGQVLTVTDPQGHVTTKVYDRAGRNWKIIAPEVDGESPITLTRFDAGSLALQVSNPLGQTVTNTYDARGLLTSTVDAAGIVNSFSYDEAGNRTGVRDGKNQLTTFAYDGLNRLISQTFANGDTWTHCHNAVQKLGQVSPRGIVTIYTYDNRDRVTATNAPGVSRQHGYDTMGRLLGVTESGNAAANVAYTYDVLGRVLTETSRGVTHSYTYDIVGNRIRADYGTGRSVQTSYDALNRPESIVEGTRATRYGYDLGGRAVILMAGNGQVTSNSYDALGRLTDRTLYRTQAMGQSDIMAKFEWQHDLLGNVTSQSETWPGEPTRPGVRTTSMAYDANNRLTNESVSDPTAGMTTTAYAYDNANNRSSKEVNGGDEPGVWSYQYNNANQLTGWEKRLDNSPVKNAALTYDDAGNRIAQTIQDQASGIQTTSYAWDAQDRLSSVTMPDGKVHSYEYDYRTRRIGTSESTANAFTKQTAIVFSGGLSLAEWETTSGTLPASPTVEYTRGPDMGGGVGGMLYSLRSGAAKYSLSNGRGDVVAQANQSATLTWTASYEAYGKRTKETGNNQDKQRANSKDEDPTGLLNEGFRYRDIETGVWLSRDPAGFVDGPNVYAYVKQNPWSAYDAQGLFLSALVEKLDEYVLTPVGEAIGEGIASVMPASTLENVTQNSKTFAMAGTALNGVKGASMTALNTLSPFDDAAKAALNGDLKGALMEGGKEIAGGKFAKAGGKLLKAGGEVMAGLAKKSDNLCASAQKNAGDAAAMVQKSSPPAVYDVGKAKDLRANAMDGTQVNHVPGSTPASSLVATQNPANKFGNEPSIRLPQSEHDAVTAAQRALGAQSSARDLLAQEVKILRNNTDAPNSAIQKVVQMNKELHEWDYKKTPK